VLPVVHGIKQLKNVFTILFAIPYTKQKLIKSAHTLQECYDWENIRDNPQITLQAQLPARCFFTKYSRHRYYIPLQLVRKFTLA
jgi:hypothetical protein